MAKTETIIGLDIGTSNIRTVVGQVDAAEREVTILGVGMVSSRGMRKGVVVDVEEATDAISKSLEKAELVTGVPVEHAYVSIGGHHILSQSSRGVIAVSRADGEVSEDDVTRVINAAQAISLPSNREIIHVIPKDFIVDEQTGIKDPVGMTGVRLEVDAHVITGSAPFIKNLTKCVYQAGVDIDDFVLAPLAASRAVLTKRQKELGVVLIDIGGGTTGIAVYEEGDLLHTAVLPIGAIHITNDIAIGIRSSIDVAEKVKLEFGSALPKDFKASEEIDLSKIDPQEEEKISRRHVAEIIEARLQEIFSMVEEELKKVERSGLLPAGAVLTGGGAKTPGIVDLAKEELRLPSQIGFPRGLPGVVEKIDEPSYATGIGLVLWGAEETEGTGFKIPGLSAVSSTVDRMKKWFKAFLP